MYAESSGSLKEFQVKGMRKTSPETLDRGKQSGDTWVLPDFSSLQTQAAWPVVMQDGIYIPATSGGSHIGCPWLIPVQIYLFCAWRTQYIV